MQIWKFFSRTPPSRPDTPPPRAGDPAALHWFPYVRIEPYQPESRRQSRPADPYGSPPPRQGPPVHLHLPDGSLRKRLVRTPDGKDFEVDRGAGPPTPSFSSTRRQSSASTSALTTAPSSVRRNLEPVFTVDSGASTPHSRPASPPSLLGQMPVQRDHKHAPRETKYPVLQDELDEEPIPPPPPLVPVPVPNPVSPAQRQPPPHAARALPALMAAFLDHGTAAAIDWAALRAAFLDEADFLTPAEVHALARALARQVVGEARPASRGMALLVDELLKPLDTRLRHELLGALTHGLQLACVALAKSASTRERQRSLGVVRDLLSRHVTQSRDRVGFARHAVQVCALARTAGREGLVEVLFGQRVFGRLLARDPVAALWHGGGAMTDAERLGVFSAALTLPPGITRSAQVAQLRERILTQAPFRLQGKALAHLIDAGRRHVPPGSWPMGRIPAGITTDMLAYKLQVGVARCVDAFDRAVKETSRSEAENLAALSRDRIGVVVGTPRGKDMAFDEEAVLRAADEVLQDRQAEALDEVVDDLAWLFTRFDVGQDPVFLRGRAFWLRQMAAPGAKPEVAVVARALAQALDQRARGLSAPPSPDRL